MKMKKQWAVCFAAAMGLVAFVGCSHSQSIKLANEMTFSLDNVSEITISYDEEQVTFYEADGDTLTIREYMTEKKSSYNAKVEQSGGSIQISEGGKPLFKKAFSRFIEVYLPPSYHEDLIITTTDGGIDASGLELFLHALRIDSTAGVVQLNAVAAEDIHLSATDGRIEAGCLSADAIRIDTTSGDFFCEKLDGNVTYTTTSGNGDILSAIGSGSYRADQSGDLHVVYAEVTGDLSFYNKNDDIHVTLPADLEFIFEATTKNGMVSTAFPEYVSTEGRTSSGTIGGHPTMTVKMETNHGNIEVKQ